MVQKKNKWHNKRKEYILNYHEAKLNDKIYTLFFDVNIFKSCDENFLQYNLKFFTN